MTDYAKLADESGGASTKDYAALAKTHGGAEAANDPLSRENLDKANAREDYRVPGTDTRIPHTGTVNQFLISTGRGMVDLWAGGKQIVGADTSEQKNELGEYAKLEKEAPVTSTVGRIVGNVAPTLAIPAGAAASGVAAVGRAVPWLSRLAGAGVGTDAMVTGGLQGAMNYAPEGDSRTANTLGGAAGGGLVGKGMETVGRVLGPTVSRGVDWLRGKVDDVVGKTGLAQTAGTRAAATADDVAASLKKEGIDWGTLPSRVRDALVQQADDAAKAGAPVTPAELARVVRAQNLPGGEAQLTKGQMTGNRQQLRDEFNLRRTKAGASLDDQLAQQDKLLADSLDVIKLKTGGDTVSGREAEAGQKITQPLLDQLKKSQEKVSALYKTADESGETLQKVDTTPLIKWVEDNFAAMHSAPAMKSLVADLKKSGLVSFSEDGAATAGREPTIREVEALRQAMVKWGKADGASGAYMGEAKRVLDGITDGKGGELYAKARAARIAQRDQFEDPGVINRLVSEKPGGDRITPFEDVFAKSVVRGSVDDLAKLRGQLLTGAGDDAALQGHGVQAFKDLRAATLDYIKLGAMDNAKDEFSYAGLKKAMDSIGREKMEVLFGKNTSNELFNVLESAKDMKAVYNKSGVYNPGTASAGMDWLINVMDHITGIVGLGKAGTYGRIFVKGGAEKIKEMVNEPKMVEQASKPVQAAMRAGEEAKADAYRTLMGMYAGKAGAKMAPAVGAAVSKPGSKDEQ